MSARPLRLLRPASVLVGLGLLLALPACSSDGATTTAVTHPTMIEVAPEEFLGDVPCTEGPGLKRYVATLYDRNYVAPGAGGADSGSDVPAGDAAPAELRLPSSRPTPCLAGVGFGLVVASRHYDVKIDGYDTDDLAPRALGSREMVSPAPSEEEPATPLATPRWSAHCEDAVAVASTIVRADHCTPFMPVDATAKGSVRIPLATLMGKLACGDEPGQIDHFDVSLDAGDGQARLQSVSCAANAEAIFEDLPPRQRVAAFVAAYSADSVDAFAGAACDAFALPESNVDADCLQLSEVGTLRIDWVDQLPEDLVCDDSSIVSITVDVPGEGQSQSLLPPECLQPFEHGFAPGAAAVTVTVRTADSQSEISLVCSAQVAPGQLALAKCEQNQQ
jgi:hypothetical protein